MIGIRRRSHTTSSLIGLNSTDLITGDDTLDIRNIQTDTEGTIGGYNDSPMLLRILFGFILHFSIIFHHRTKSVFILLFDSVVDLMKTIYVRSQNQNSGILLEFLRVSQLIQNHFNTLIEDLLGILISHIIQDREPNLLLGRFDRSQRRMGIIDDGHTGHIPNPLVGSG